MEAAIEKLVSRLEAVTARLETVEKQVAGGAGASAPAGGASAGPAAGAAWVSEFEGFLKADIEPLVALSNKFGNAELKSQVAALEKALNAHKDFLNVASACKKPDDATLGKLLQPTSELVMEVIKIRDSNRGNAQWNHLSALSEGVPALGWVTIKPTPGPFVNEYKGNAEFYSNKLLREYKGKDEDQVAWCNHLKNFFTNLIAFIKQYHTTELVWNAKGGDAGSYTPSAAPAAAAPAGGPPPPPAGAPPPAAVAKKGPDMGALFASINQGTGVSSGLKKVTSDMKTKNRKPEERSAVVPAGDAKPKAAPARAGARVAKKGTPLLQLQGNKWVCEFFDDRNDLVIEDTEPKQTVYLYKCDKCVLNIKGTKVNSICLDSCNRVSLVFNSAIASVETVNCNNVEVQCQGSVPAFAIDKCSGVQLYLSNDCLGAEIVSSKSDQMNILITKDGDLVEMAIAEQFKTIYNNGKLETGPVEHV